MLFRPSSSWAAYVPFSMMLIVYHLVLVRGCTSKDKVVKLDNIQFIHFNFALKKIRAFTLSVTGYQAYFEWNVVGKWYSKSR
jgi:nitric oxide reductase large subunit